MLVEIKHDFGVSVYLKTDKDQLERIITLFQINPGNLVTYQLACGTGTSWHFDFEFTLEKDIVKQTT